MEQQLRELGAGVRERGEAVALVVELGEDRVDGERGEPLQQLAQRSIGEPITSSEKRNETTIHKADVQ